MEEEVRRKYYSLAKYPNLEILMDAQLSSAGANQAKLLEKYKKNKKSVKHQLLALKIVYGFIFVFIPAITIIGFLDISQDYPSAPMETILFTYALVFGIFFIMSILYVLLMGLFSTSSFMSGNAFKWLQTLPFSKKELKKLGYVTVFRNLDVALIAMVLGLPTILFIMSRDIILFLISIVSSAFNAIFAFSILIILSQKMANVFSESKVNSKKKYILRIATMGGFFILAFGTSFILTFFMNSIGNIFVIFPTNESAVLINRILSLIPFPFGISYLIAFITTPGTIPPDLIFTSMIGFALCIGLVYLLYRVAIKQIRSATATEIEVDKKGKKQVLVKEDISVEIKTISTTSSFIRKDLISTTRDYQSFIFLIMPIIYPVILILSMTPVIAEEISSLDSIIILWSVVVGVNQFIPFMLVAGFLNMEESGATILASLPLLSRKQARAKIYLILAIQGIGLCIMGIVLMIMTQSLLLLILFLLTIPIAWILLLFTFEIKIRLFGRTKYKYVLEEVNKERKVLKWLVIICSELLIYFAIIIIEFSLLAFSGILGMIIGLVVIGIIGLSSLYYVFTKMFPKEREIATYYTGGLLRRNVLVGAIVIMILYFLFQNIVGFIELPLLPILNDLSFELVILIEVILVFMVFTLLFFVVVPKGMKLPNGKETLKQYSNTIGFTKVRPFEKNVVIIACSIPLLVIPTIVFALFGVLTIDVGIFAAISAFFFRYPLWIFFYYMLIPGVWEEIAFRGVILRLQLRKFSKLTSVILNGILFGLMHFVNLLTIGNLFSVLNQVFYATCLGIAFAYIYIKTESLLPSMLLHYFINVFVQGLVFNTTNAAILTSYLAFGLGLIPMVLILALVKIIDLIRKRS
ncbi:MAG: type II CAAX prenyl endopeptidase Rce1 family protein [Promethearchaeota archaeon]